MEDLKRILIAHPFLQGIEPGYIDLVVGCAYNIKVDEGKYIFREGREADNFYFIREGKVALEIFSPQQGPIVIETIEDGDVLGWSWLIPPYLWKFDAKAVEQVRAIAFDGKCLRNKCEEDHDLGYELLMRFAHIIEERLQATRLRLLDLYGIII
jgi:CRP-like cAMP-binding protein